MKGQSTLQVRDLNLIRRTEKKQEERLQIIEKYSNDHPEELASLLTDIKKYSDDAIVGFYKWVKSRKEHNEKCIEYGLEHMLNTLDCGWDYLFSYRVLCNNFRLNGIVYFLIEHGYLIQDHRIGLIFNENGGI